MEPQEFYTELGQREIEESNEKRTEHRENRISVFRLC